jgi:hypothetical protein
MNPVSDLHAELHEVVARIERLNRLMHTHRQQAIPDTLALEGYALLKHQYAQQLIDLLTDLELDLDIRSKAA